MAEPVCKVSCGHYTLRNWYNCPTYEKETFLDLYSRLANGEIDGIGLAERYADAKVTVYVANGVAQKYNTKVDASAKINDTLTTHGKYVEFIVSDNFFTKEIVTATKTSAITSLASLEAMLSAKKHRTKACKEQLKFAVIDWLKNNN